VGYFTNAPDYQPAVKKKKKGWSKFAQRAKQKRDMRLLVEENIRLRAHNERLVAQNKRLQGEFDALWDSVSVSDHASTPEAQWYEDHLNQRKSQR
jgi:hypothetical protein